jgi:hypothetical protein
LTSSQCNGEWGHNVIKGSCGTIPSMSETSDLEKRITNLEESIHSMHGRLDRFYAWAGLLQSEFRNMKQRTAFMEGMLQERFNFNQPQSPCTHAQVERKVFGGDDDNALWARMMRITGKDTAS